MTLHALFCAMDDVSRVIHSQRNRFVMRPRASRVRPQPRGRRPVAVFTRDTLGNFERTPLLFRAAIERVACQALWCFFRLGAELENSRHSLANVSGESLIRLSVLVLENPGGVFVLQDAAPGNRFHAAVTTRGGARSGTDILDGLGLRGNQEYRRRQKEK